MIVVLSVGRRHFDERRTELRRGTVVGQRVGGRGANAVTGESGFELLIGGERYRADVGSHHAYIGHAAEDGRARAIVESVEAEARGGAGDQAAVIAPVETNPGPALPGLILQMGGLVEFLVMIDPEGKACRGGDGGSGAADLRLEKASRHTRKNEESRKATNLRHAETASVTRNFGVVPLDREGDRSV